MSSSLAIRAEGLGKSYRVPGTQSGHPYRTLREDLLALPRSMMRAFQNPAVRSSRPFWALRDVSFDLHRGDVLGIVGRNGAGKTTLLKLLARITEPTAGSAEIYGRVGTLLEVGTGFHPELTGRENVYLSGAILGMRRGEIDRRFDQILEYAGVQRFVDTPVKRYSTGMFMRLAFAVAAHLDADVLVVDEVLAVGDARFQKKCLGTMDALARSGRAVIFVSHNLGAVRTLCSRALWLESGMLRAAGPVESITRDYLAHRRAQGPGRNVETSQHRISSPDVAIETAALRDAHGAERAAFLIGEPFEIALGYRVAHPIEGSFWLLIHNADGVAVFSSFQRDSAAAQRIATDGTALVRVEGISLLPGSFTVSAGIFSSSGLIVDWADEVVDFEVLPQFADGRPYDDRHGLVTRELHWEVRDGRSL